MILKFKEEKNQIVYTDFIAYNNQNQILALSLIGPEILLKAYRGMFLDNGINYYSSYKFYFFSNEINTFLRIPFTKVGSYRSLPIKKIGQGYQLFLISDRAIYGSSNEEVYLSLYNYLYELNVPCPTPLDKEFNDCMDKILKLSQADGYIIPCTVESDVSFQVYDISPSIFNLNFRKLAEEIIASFLEESGDILEGVEGIADYIEKYADKIGEKVGKRISYLHTPKDYDEKFFSSLNRRLYPHQKDIAIAAAKKIGKDKRVIISGQMGVGKTTMGITACQYHSSHIKNHRGYRTIITCPSHLQEKWAREIRTVLPEAEVFCFIENKKQKPWQLFYWQYLKSSLKPEKAEYWIVSNETLRGGYSKKSGYAVKKKKMLDIEQERRVYKDVCICPDCGSYLMKEIETSDYRRIKVNMTPEDFAKHTQDNHSCPHCRAVLWQADGKRKGYRKVAIIEMIKKLIPKGFFDYYIADEAHKYKGATAQGIAFGGLINKSRYTIAMTGTLTDGYAGGLYYLLWRMKPEKFKAKGFKYSEESRSRFQMEYGFWEKISKTVEKEYGKTSRSYKTQTYTKLLPGYTINTFPEWLMEETLFLKLSDVVADLPPKTEFVNTVEMDEELKNNYKEIEDKFRRIVVEEKNYSAASAMLHTCMAYLDFGLEVEKAIAVGDILVHIPPLQKDKLYNKEIELQRIVRNELNQGRKCIVFTTYTQNRDCLPRLEWVLKQVEGANVQVMRANTVDSAKREKFINLKIEQGKNVLICHPGLVETGLDLLEFPTIIWMQTGYVPALVQQASARSWRIGQEKEVKVIFLCYKDSIQEKCFALVGQKLNASGILEGNLDNEGLRRFGSTNNMIDILTLLKDNIKTVTANDIFESYKVETAKILEFKKPEKKFKTLKEIMVEQKIDISSLSKKQQKYLQSNQEQLVLFL